MDSTIAVIGTGYVGLTTGACLAHLGHDGHLRRRRRREGGRRCSAARCRSSRHGLDELVQEGVRSGRLTFVARRRRPRSKASEFVYLCVPTPQGEDGSADLSLHRGGGHARSAPHLQPEAIVVNKSTVPVGSTRVVERALGRGDVYVVSNPEFLREGSAVHDFLHPDRVVIGCDDQAAAVRVASLYLSLAAPLMVTDPASAETIKYATNAFLATKISFVNAVAAVCEAVGADVNDVVLGMGYDKRIGHEFLRPGPGLGRLVLPEGHPGPRPHRRGRGLRLRPAQGRDRRSTTSSSTGSPTRSSQAAGGSVDGKTIAVWGLTFKARTDDLRDSPVARDHQAPRRRRAPTCGPTTRPSTGQLEGIEVVDDPYGACEGAEVLVVLTEWDEFRWLDLDKVAERHGQRRASSTPATCSTGSRCAAAASRTQGIGRR